MKKKGIWSTLSGDMKDYPVFNLLVGSILVMMGIVGLIVGYSWPLSLALGAHDTFAPMYFLLAILLGIGLIVMGVIHVAEMRTEVGGKNAEQESEKSAEQENEKRRES